jgi:hypothetical protein
VQASSFDEDEFFRRIARSGSRALLIGRRALAALGLPLLTAGHDFWLHPDDISAFNASVTMFDLRPTRQPAEARQAGRYVLENDEHVDVLVARALRGGAGADVVFRRKGGR